MKGRERMLAACRFEPVDRPPVWLMRQAGRYLPEYQEVRRGRDFWTLVRTPEIASDVTLQPVRRYGVDAAIVFCDILVVPHAMGVEVTYGEGGPSLAPLVAGMEDVQRLRGFDARRDAPWLAETLGLVRQGLDGEALIGFAGAPFTLAAYMVEGRVTPDLTVIKPLGYREPGTLSLLLDRLADAVADLLEMQVEAGADVVQVFDTWAGRLAPEDYEAWALPALWKVVERLRGRVPVIVYVNGVAGILESVASSGCDVVSVDHRIRLEEARERLGRRAALQGNLDPLRLQGPEEEIRHRVREMVRATGGVGHVVNLGHGVLPPTPIGGVGVFVDAVREGR